MPGSTTRRQASFTSAGTPRRIGISAGWICRGNGSRATWITWSTSFAARPRSLSRGSAFQALGLELAMTELERPSWRKLLENVVDVEIDYSTRRKLPGFLSESYSGEGVQYTGSVGISDITVSPLPRITDAASLYTLGAAYSVAPEKIEQFLAASWPLMAKLLTEHGPWEGLKGSNQEVIRFQTTAHTLALILGLLGTGS